MREGGKESISGWAGQQVCCPMSGAGFKFDLMAES